MRFWKSAPAEEATLKKIMFALAAVVAVTGAVRAGDIPQRYNNNPQVYRNLFNWTGFYGGLNGGWGWSDANGNDQSGYLIGGQLGYNYQLVSGMLFGVETDITFTGIDGAIPGGNFAVNNIGTIRGRLGYAFDRVMLYATGGLAYANGEVTVASLSNDQTHWGFALGAGIEGMISPNVSVRLEYIYTDFGSQTYTTIGGPLGVGFSASMLRAGVNYRF